MNPRPQLPVTTRLQLREMCPADIDWLDRLNSDADVMRYLGGPASRASTEQMLSGRILRYYDEHPGLGVWATVERSSGAVLGFHLLNHIRGEAYIQVGYRLFREAGGRATPPKWRGRCSTTDLIRWAWRRSSRSPTSAMSARNGC